jgi:hypothetical protein
MYWGSRVAHVSWLTMLPGCLLAGVGLGLTNTPVSNTTTGSVPGDRAGMASGIDMSARLITLAINIALMGFVLIQGIAAYLRATYPEMAMSPGLRLLAEQIAAGTSVSDTTVSTEAALVHGFGWVMLYGGLGVWALAAVSLMVFGRRDE